MGTTKRCYILVSLTEKDFDTNRPLAWSNDMGWVARRTATLFTQAEAQRAQLVGKFWIAYVSPQERSQFEPAC